MSHQRSSLVGCRSRSTLLALNSFNHSTLAKSADELAARSFPVTDLGGAPRVVFHEVDVRTVLANGHARCHHRSSPQPSL